MLSYAALHAGFRKADVDDSGDLTPHEMEWLVKHLQLCTPNAAGGLQSMHQRWSEVDANGDGRVTFDEFLAWYCEAYGCPVIPDFRDFIASGAPEEKPVEEGARAERYLRKLQRSLTQISQMPRAPVAAAPRPAGRDLRAGRGRPARPASLEKQVTQRLGAGSP